MTPPWHEGWPTILVACAAFYLVAELQNRWLALGVCAVGFMWLLVMLRREARTRIDELAANGPGRGVFARHNQGAAQGAGAFALSSQASAGRSSGEAVSPRGERGD